MDGAGNERINLESLRHLMPQLDVLAAAMRQPLGRRSGFRPRSGTGSRRGGGRRRHPPEEEKTVLCATLEVGFFRNRFEFQPTWRSTQGGLTLCALLGDRARRLRLEVLAPRSPDTNTAADPVLPGESAWGDGGVSALGHNAASLSAALDDIAPHWMEEEDSEYRMDFLFRDLELLGIHERAGDHTRGAALGATSYGGGSAKVALAFWIKSLPHVHSRPFPREDIPLFISEFVDREREWSRAGDFTGGGLPVAKVLFVVVERARMGEIEALEEALCAPSVRHVRKRSSPCQFWGIEDLGKVRVSRNAFTPPPPLTLTPFVTLSPTFDSDPQRPTIPFDVLLLLTILVQKALVPPSALTPQLYALLSEASTGHGRAGERAKAECKGDLSHFIMHYRKPIFDLAAYLRRQQARRKEREDRLNGATGQKKRAGKGIQGEAKGESGFKEMERGWWRVGGHIERPLPEGYCRVPRLQITPLGAEAQEPSLELPNGVLRHFAKRELEHCFLRVSFQDEDLNPLGAFALQQGVGLPGPNELYLRILNLVSKVGFATMQDSRISDIYR